mmetsp:Transcript_89653/g.214301  ORF Transcript_89653/g.214301 Transcript_89653/m.214301 type:complete len:219 (-) Transcript_89653:39-695(-)
MSSTVSGESFSCWWPQATKISVTTSRFVCLSVCRFSCTLTSPMSIWTRPAAFRPNLCSAKFMMASRMLADCMDTTAQPMLLCLCTWQISPFVSMGCFAPESGLRFTLSILPLPPFAISASTSATVFGLGVASAFLLPSPLPSPPFAKPLPPFLPFESSDFPFPLPLLLSSPSSLSLKSPLPFFPESLDLPFSLPLPSFASPLLGFVSQPQSFQLHQSE